MSFILSIKSFFDRMDRKTFTQYVLGGFALLLIIASILLFNFYRKTNALRIKIDDINELREQVRDVLSKASLLQQKRLEVKEVLEEEADFKIAGYVRDILLKDLGLQASSDISPIQEDRPGEYKETILTFSIENISMQQVTELLQTIYKKRRIYIKNLDIIRSKKNRDAVDITLTIATLHFKTEQPDTME